MQNSIDGLLLGSRSSNADADDRLGFWEKINMSALAFYVYPLPQGTPFTSDDLSVSDNVEKLFDYMQILLAVVSKEGWDFLIRKYGYERLFEINNRSGWIDSETLDEFIEALKYEEEISPEIV
ncbi:hypothetical protein [uncultured Acetatifactor sp.]|uniref:hypothetical protein n=2 Tax=uncultured Acetatifactor sp. TaxID=1671927 RepID=UPI002614BC42|nr:hypothetical protein [uncultured Acetatifactor sp.]